MENQSTLELGVWMGRSEVSGLIHNKCSALQAECLKQIRDGNLYTSLSLTWEEFCRQHLGVSRAHADRVIRRLQEFGANYFRLSELMQISEETYRALEPSITGEQINVDGELIPITPENGSRIREAVRALRNELRAAKALRPTCTSITDLQFRLDGCFSMMERLHRGSSDSLTVNSLVGLVGYSMDRLRMIAQQLENKR